MSRDELYDVCGWCRAGEHERCSALSFPRCASARCACAHGAEAEELARLLPGLPGAISAVRNADDGGEGGDHARNLTRACELLLGERERLTRAMADMTADRDRLKRREQDIIEACERVADGGQYRADIVSAINRIREERDEARARAAELEARLDRLHRLLVTDARDWSTGWCDAMIYAIVVGWGDALHEVAERHGWTAEMQQRLVELGPRE